MRGGSLSRYHPPAQEGEGLTDELLRAAAPVALQALQSRLYSSSPQSDMEHCDRKVKKSTRPSATPRRPAATSRKRLGVGSNGMKGMRYVWKWSI